MSQMPRPEHACPDCSDVNRRDFLKTTAAGLTAASIGAAGLWSPSPARAAEKSVAAKPETLAAALYKSLSEQQKKQICFSFDDPLRQAVDNNWHITKTPVSSYTAEQQEMIRDIFLGLHSPEYADKVMQQVEHDNKGGQNGGFKSCSIAMFGEPGTGKFEFVFTGRHVTRRCDGDSVEGAAFGGPIFYGHAYEAFNEKPTHPGNVYWYQALRANEVFKALDGKQQKLALLGDPREEEATKTVALSGKKSGLAGIPMSELSSDQKDLVRKVMDDVLAPFRKEDVAESMKLIEAGGLDNLHLSFYKNMDLGNDGVWDVWQIEGPAMVWYFRGSPHVHTWVNIRQPA